MDGRLVGCTPDYAEVTRLEIDRGHFITDADVNERMRTMDHFKCPTAAALKHAEMAEKDNQSGWRTYSLNGRIGTDREPSR